MLFDLQPITTGDIITGAVGLVAIGTLWYLYRGFGVSRGSAEAAQKTAEIAQQTAELALSDSESRNRPWMTLIHCGVLDNSGSLENDVLFLGFKNAGVLPARNVSLSLEFHVDTDQWEQLEEGNRELVPLTEVTGQLPSTTVFPEAPNEYQLDFAAGSKWRIFDLDVYITGSMNYDHGEKHYSTGFVVKIIFVNKGNGPIEWRHTDVT